VCGRPTRAQPASCGCGPGHGLCCPGPGHCRLPLAAAASRRRHPPRRRCQLGGCPSWARCMPSCCAGIRVCRQPPCHSHRSRQLRCGRRRLRQPGQAPQRRLACGPYRGWARARCTARHSRTRTSRASRPSLAPRQVPLPGRQWRQSGCLMSVPQLAQTTCECRVVFQPRQAS
jgi:hypothetical protein